MVSWADAKKLRKRYAQQLKQPESSLSRRTAAARVYVCASVNGRKLSHRCGTRNVVGKHFSA